MPLGLSGFLAGSGWRVATGFSSTLGGCGALVSESPPRCWSRILVAGSVVVMLWGSPLHPGTGSIRYPIKPFRRWPPMVANGKDVSPEMRCRDSVSSAVLTVRSVNGMPRPHEQCAGRVTGSALAGGVQRDRVFVGHLAQLKRQAGAGRRAAGTYAGAHHFALVGVAGGLSEKVTLPSAPTMR